MMLSVESLVVFSNAEDRSRRLGLRGVSPAGLLESLATNPYLEVWKAMGPAQAVIRDYLVSNPEPLRVPPGSGSVLCTEDTVSVLRMAGEEARLLGRASIEPIHLLLGLIRVWENRQNLLTKQGVTLDSVRDVARGLDLAKSPSQPPASKCNPCVSVNTASSLAGKLVFLERPNTDEDIKRGGSPVDMYSGEWLILRETPNCLYCVKPVGCYGCHDAKPFSLVGSRPWTLVSASDTDLVSLCLDIESFIESGNKPSPQWMRSVYNGASSTLRRIREIIGEQCPGKSPAESPACDPSPREYVEAFCLSEQNRLAIQRDQQIADMAVAYQRLVPLVIEAQALHGRAVLAEVRDVLRKARAVIDGASGLIDPCAKPSGSGRVAAEYGLDVSDQQLAAWRAAFPGAV